MDLLESGGLGCNIPVLHGNTRRYSGFVGAKTNGAIQILQGEDNGKNLL